MRIGFHLDETLIRLLKRWIYVVSSSSIILLPIKLTDILLEFNSCMHELHFCTQHWGNAYFSYVFAELQHRACIKILLSCTDCTEHTHSTDSIWDVSDHFGSVSALVEPINNVLCIAFLCQITDWEGGWMSPSLPSNNSNFCAWMSSTPTDNGIFYMDDKKCSARGGYVCAASKSGNNLKCLEKQPPPSIIHFQMFLRRYHVTKALVQTMCNSKTIMCAIMCTMGALCHGVMRWSSVEKDLWTGHWQVFLPRISLTHSEARWKAEKTDGE